MVKNDLQFNHYFVVININDRLNKNLRKPMTSLFDKHFGNNSNKYIKHKKEINLNIVFMSQMLVQLCPQIL